MMLKDKAIRERELPSLVRTLPVVAIHGAKESAVDSMIEKRFFNGHYFFIHPSETRKLVNDYECMARYYNTISSALGFSGCFRIDIKGNDLSFSDNPSLILITGKGLESHLKDYSPNSNQPLFRSYQAIAAGYPNALITTGLIRKGTGWKTFPVDEGYRNTREGIIDLTPVKFEEEDEIILKKRLKTILESSSEFGGPYQASKIIAETTRLFGDKVIKAVHKKYLK